MPKQIRFMQLVNSSGRPHSATLWAGDPDKDPEFKRAIAENRILTVLIPNVGNRKETGFIGFSKGSGATYLIFPKSLPMDVGTRVIGLKFDQLADVPAKDRTKRRTKKGDPKP